MHNGTHVCGHKAVGVRRRLNEEPSKFLLLQNEVMLKTERTEEVKLSCELRTNSKGKIIEESVFILK